jgi:hypothetical protein
LTYVFREDVVKRLRFLRDEAAEKVFEKASPVQRQGALDDGLHVHFRNDAVSVTDEPG